MDRCILEEREHLEHEVTTLAQDMQRSDRLAEMEVRHCGLLFVWVSLTIDAPIGCNDVRTIGRARAKHLDATLVGREYQHLSGDERRGQARGDDTPTER